jgi:hypothetical protein
LPPPVIGERSERRARPLQSAALNEHHAVDPFEALNQVLDAFVIVPGAVDLRSASFAKVSPAARRVTAECCFAR